MPRQVSNRNFYGPFVQRRLIARCFLTNFRMFAFRRFLIALLFACPLLGYAQTRPTPSPMSTPIDGLARTSPSPNATPIVFSSTTLADLKRLQQAALTSDYAYRQVAHLSNNIGARLTGSAQAAKAVEYVANELKSIGCEVQLEKVMVPHWVRGEETAALVQWPGMADHTAQKI